ncbi:MAG: dipeptidase PepE [Chloroflexota bacterium]|nr:dipeptidase PepE [Chloroflexota bacterium]
MTLDLLLLSSSALHGYRPFEFALDALHDLFGGAQTVHFVPYALADHGGYTAGVGERLAPLGVSVIGVHAGGDPRAAVEAAEVLFVGGGNSFRLLDALQRHALLEPIRRRVQSGELRYLGSSAGTNMACPSLRTTNDMPIVQPRSFAALGLIPFQINPHYVDPDPATTHMGETREQRLLEFLEENDVPVLGMREGTWLRRRDDRLTLGGVTAARLFRRGAEPREYGPGADLSRLLDVPARFDHPA